MGFFQDRPFRMFQPSKSIEELAVRIEDLRHILNSAVHDIVVLKNVLEEKGLMDAALYKQLRMHQMLRDHGGPGPASWQYMSIYPYTLDEKDFLRQALKADEAEAERFQKDAEDRRMMT